MKKFTIAPADAADDMRRNYRREVRRHRERTQKRNHAVAIGAVALVLVALVANVALARLAPKKELPKTAFEVRAERDANAKQTAAAKKPSAEKKSVAGSSKSGSDGEARSTTAAKPKAAAKPPVSAGKTPAGTKVASAPGKTTTSKPVAVAPLSADAIRVRVGKDGFGPDDIVVPLGRPVALFIEQAGAGEPIGFEIPTLGVQADNSKSAVNVRAGSPSAGTYRFYSYNRSIEGTLTIR